MFLLYKNDNESTSYAEPDIAIIRVKAEDKVRPLPSQDSTNTGKRINV
jgi:hypothetical protein